MDRIDLDEILPLVDRREYFTIRAPRQTGKTSMLPALADLLNGSGKYRCVSVNFEAGQAAREDTARAMRTLLGRLGSRARRILQDDFIHRAKSRMLEEFGLDGALEETLREWSARSAKPEVLPLDEIDAPEGDTLISVLRQLRSEHDMRPSEFPPTASHRAAAERRWASGCGRARDLGLLPRQVKPGRPSCRGSSTAGGRVEREYGSGRRRSDLQIYWPAAGEGAEPHAQQKAVIECKERHGSVETTISEGLSQTAACMDRAGTEDGQLVIFGRSAGATWKQKSFCRKEVADGKLVTV